MPWFITAINIRNTFQVESEHKRIVYAQRTFGFFDKYIDAYNAVVGNKGDMREALYNYLVIEYMESGIHPTVLKEEWWMWQVSEWENDKWILVSKPNDICFIGTNWALG